MRGNDTQDESRDEFAVDMTDQETRRSLMKKAGVGATAFLGSVAGCTGGSDSGDGGDGGDGGDSGDGGSDGGGGTEKTVRLLMAPDGFMGIIFKKFQKDTDTFEQYFQEAGLSLEVSETYEGAAVFTAGGADFESFGTMEAAIIGSEREIPLACHANLVPIFQEVYTQRGGPYDPEEVGSTEAVVDKQYEERTPMTVNNWGSGYVPALMILYDQAWDYNFSQEREESDIPGQTTQNYTMAQLLNQGDLRLGVNSPEHGLAPYMLGEDPNVTNVFQISTALQDLGFGVPQQNSWTCSQEFAADYPEAPETLVPAYQEGTDWLFSDPFEIITSSQTHMDMLGMEEEEPVKFMIEWGVELSSPGPWENDKPIQYKDTELTEDFIEADKEFLQAVEESGFIQGTWRDFLEYRPVSTDYGEGHFDG